MQMKRRIELAAADAAAVAVAAAGFRVVLA